MVTFILENKLTRKELADLEVTFQDISFSCDALLQDLELPDSVYTRDLSHGSQKLCIRLAAYKDTRLM